MGAVFLQVKCRVYIVSSIVLLGRLQTKKQARHLHLLVRDLGLFVLFLLVCFFWVRCVCVCFVFRFFFFLRVGEAKIPKMKANQAHHLHLLVRDLGLVRISILNRIILIQVCLNKEVVIGFIPDQ